MTSEEKEQISRLHTEGLGYKKIAQVTGISVNTVRSFCMRNLRGESEDTQDNESPGPKCEYCGKVVNQLPHRKRKRFCSDRCRMAWWNSHPSQVKRKTKFEYVCPTCKRTFIVYGNKNRKYCSLDCYFKARYGGKTNETES